MGYLIYNSGEICKVTALITAQDIINSALKHPRPGYRNISEYKNAIENEIFTCGLSISKGYRGLSQVEEPLIIEDRKRRPRPIGTIYMLSIPAQGQDELGYIINDIINFKIQENIIVMRHKLYMSSYAYHIELLSDSIKYYRFEKSELPNLDNDYKPDLHMHCMGRLLHYPAPEVTVGQLLRNLKANTFDPANRDKLDPLWGRLIDIK